MLFSDNCKRDKDRQSACRRTVGLGKGSRKAEESGKEFAENKSKNARVLILLCFTNSSFPYDKKQAAKSINLSLREIASCVKLGRTELEV
jgi:hypothetical protein